MSILSIMPHEDFASRLAGSTRFATASSRFQSSAVFAKLGNSCWILPRRTCNKYLFIIGKILLPKHNHLLSFIAQKQIEYCSHCDVLNWWMCFDLQLPNFYWEYVTILWLWRDRRSKMKNISLSFMDAPSKNACTSMFCKGLSGLPIAESNST